MTGEEAISMICKELRKAENKHPGWPIDPIHASAIAFEEKGETAQAAIDFVYADGSRENMAKEAAHVGAMAIRFLLGIDDYKRTKAGTFLFLFRFRTI